MAGYDSSDDNDAHDEIFMNNIVSDKVASDKTVNKILKFYDKPKNYFFIPLTGADPNPTLSGANEWLKTPEAIPYILEAYAKYCQDMLDKKQNFTK